MNIANLIAKLNNEQLRGLQERILNRAYACPPKSPTRARRNTQYELTVAELIKRLGADSSVYDIDADLGQMFSDCFKDENNVRPGAWSYALAKEYMDARYGKS